MNFRPFHSIEGLRFIQICADSSGLPHFGELQDLTTRIESLREKQASKE
jgi:hypothetical protein